MLLSPLVQFTETMSLNSVRLWLSHRGLTVQACSRRVRLQFPLGGPGRGLPAGMCPRVGVGEGIRGRRPRSLPPLGLRVSVVCFRLCLQVQSHCVGHPLGVAAPSQAHTHREWGPRGAGPARRHRVRNVRDGGSHEVSPATRLPVPWCVFLCVHLSALTVHLSALTVHLDRAGTASVPLGPEACTPSLAELPPLRTPVSCLRCAHPVHGAGPGPGVLCKPLFTLGLAPFNGNLVNGFLPLYSVPVNAQTENAHRRVPGPRRGGEDRLLEPGPWPRRREGNTACPSPGETGSVSGSASPCVCGVCFLPAFSLCVSSTASCPFKRSFKM